MAAPTFIDSGTGATDAGGAWSYTCQASAEAGNLFIVQILQDGSTSSAIGDITGTNIEDIYGVNDTWTSLTSNGRAVGSPLVGRQFLYFGRALSTAAPTISGTNSTSEDLYIRSYQFSGADPNALYLTGLIENGTAGGIATTSGTDGTVTDAGVTTLGPDRLALQFIAISDDNAQSFFEGETGGDWKQPITAYAESSGTDGSIGLQIALEPWTSNAQGSASLQSVVYDNGYWVAVGDTGTLYYKTSLDGAWTSNAQGTLDIQSVAYGNGYWVAVGASGTLYYKASTPDGSWTSNTQGTSAFFSVAYANGYWVAVGGVGNLYYKASTPDGAWTSNPQGTATFQSVVYDNGYWVAVGDFGTVYYKASTPDGAWTSNTQGTGYFYSVAYGNGYWVAVGTGGTLYYKASTPDGAWTSNTQGSSLYGVAYGNGYWVIVGISGTRSYALSNPLSWASHNQGSAMLNSVAYANGYWVAVGASGTLYYSTIPAPVPASATTIDGGTFTNPDSADGWGVIGFALIGTTKVSMAPFRRLNPLIYR